MDARRDTTGRSGVISRFLPWNFGVMLMVFYVYVETHQFQQLYFSDGRIFILLLSDYLGFYALRQIFGANAEESFECLVFR